MADLKARQRVAIAGTVTNLDTGDIVPQVVVRITEAPPGFVAMLMATVEAVLVNHPELMAHYGHLLNRAITADTLKTAQILLDSFERHHWLSTLRQDQTITGGDGHYCFFDLPPGPYTITGTVTTLNHRCGLVQAQVEVKQTELRLAFSRLDLAVALRPVQLAIPAQGLRRNLTLDTVPLLSRS
ncbi:MAG: hypothetical protein ACFCVD_04445 [Nodosilinea sp.]